MFKNFLLGVLVSQSAVSGFVLSFEASDFGTSPQFSSVTTFDFTADVAENFRFGTFSDPVLNEIGYNVSGALDATPSGFPAFSFQLSHLVAPPPAGPELISGIQFYSLNPNAPAGDRLNFAISAGADFSDGLQVSELEGTGNDVVFRFNGREEGTGRYHPIFIELRADGTGLIQNADNFGGDNPFDGFVGDINVDFGEEYITNLTFDPTTLTIAVPEPTVSLLSLVAGVFFVRRRNRGDMVAKFA